MTTRQSNAMRYLALTLLSALALMLTQCDRERPITPLPATGSIALEVDVPQRGGAGEPAAKVAITRGTLRINGSQIEEEITRNIPVQSGRLQSRVDGIPVGQVTVELTLHEADDAVVWEGSTQVSVVANQTAPASIVLKAVDDQAPEANFSFSPEQGQVTTNFHFVAEVEDRHETAEELEVRWDFDNDGSFETDWAVSKQVDRSFSSPGDYRINMEVRDKGGKVANVTKQVTIENTLPFARAGQDITRNAGQIVQLDGNGSSDPDGQNLIFAWTQTAGTPVNLQNGDTPTPSFMPEEAGIYAFSLVVRDGVGESPMDEVVITVIGGSTEGQNNPPIANAGSDRMGPAGQLVRLDGRDSRDPDGDPLTYEWVQTGGPGVDLQGVNSSLAEFVPPDPGVYIFSLQVSDGQTTSQVDEVQVTVNEPAGSVELNAVPVASAYGPEEDVFTGVEVVLDGSGSSDGDEDPLSYTWGQVSGPQVALQGADGEFPIFTPADPGTYVFELVVSDGKDDSQPDQVRINVVEPPPDLNAVPVAVASGPEMDIVIGTEVVLDASGSFDDDGDPLGYAWNQVSGPQVELQDASGEFPRFVPTDPGTYVFELVVSDGKDDSQPDQVAVTAVESSGGDNNPPIADAGADRPGLVGNLIRLDGRGSSDPDGDPLTYDWVQTNGPGVELQKADSALPEFTPTDPGIYIFSLQVSDGQMTSQVSQVRVTITGIDGPEPSNAAPVAVASGPEADVVAGTEVLLDGSGSRDDDGDPLSYIWAQVSGPQVALNGADSEFPLFTPVDPGTYVFELVVSDGKEDSQPDQVRINVVEPPPGNAAPVAVAFGPDMDVPVGMEVVLDASGSFDDDGDALVYTWTQVSGPTVALNGADSEFPSFTPMDPGAYVFELVVSDGKVNSQLEQVQVNVVEPVEPPPGNEPPNAEVAGPGFATVGEEVVLDGSGSWDPEAEPVGYRWTQVGGPDLGYEPGGFDFAPGAAFFRFVPQVPGEYAFRLVVSDGELQSGPFPISVNVEEVVADNMAPVAVAHAPDQVMTGDLVVLDGADSYDPDGDPIGFFWMQTDGPAVVLSDDQSAMPTFTPPDPGAYVFDLIVDDGDLESQKVSVTVNVNEDTSVDFSLPRIVFSSDRDGNPAIFTINTLGQQPQKVTNGDGGGDVEPEGSPDGTRIVYASYRDGMIDPFDGNFSAEIYVMDADGSAQQRLTNNQYPDGQPTWSLDQQRILFVSARNSEAFGYVNTDIWMMNADGSGQVNLTSGEAGLESEPDWSPEGRKIVFTSFRDFDEFGNIHSEIYSMNADGSNWVNLTNNPAIDANPDWAPDGSRIAFSSNRAPGGTGLSDVWIINPDGSNPINLTRNPGSNDWYPAWGPEGRTIAFLSDRDGLQEVWLMNITGFNQRKLADGYAQAGWPSWLRAFEALAKPSR